MVSVLAASMFCREMLFVTMEPPRLSIEALDAVKLVRLLAISVLYTCRLLVYRDEVVALFVRSIPVAIIPVLRLDMIAAPILRVPVGGAVMDPERMIVDARTVDVFTFEVVILLVKFAVFAAILEMSKEPAGFRICAELRTKDDACVAMRLLKMVRLLVLTAFDAWTLAVLMLGVVMGAEKRMSLVRF